jgi:hypothetical protein
MNELFTEATGFPVDTMHLAMLELYSLAGDDDDTLEQIADMSQWYPDPETAEVGFIVVWDAMVKS